MLEVLGRQTYMSTDTTRDVAPPIFASAATTRKNRSAAENQPTCSIHEVGAQLIHATGGLVGLGELSACRHHENAVVHDVYIVFVSHPTTAPLVVPSVVTNTSWHPGMSFIADSA